MRLKTARPDDTVLETEIQEHFGDINLARDPSLADDAKHLADAVRAGAPYFITNDANLISLGQEWAIAYGLEILRPHQFAMRMFDSGSVGNRFEVGIFEHIDLQWADAAERDERDLQDTFMNFPDREKLQDFTSELRAVLAYRATYSVRVLEDADHRPLALAAIASGGVLQVPLLRVARVRLATSIALQLARELRRNAIDNGLTHIQVTDPSMSTATKNALMEDGFVADAGAFQATVIARHLDLTSGRSVDLGVGAPATGDVDWSAAAVEEMERRYWPLRMWDATTPCYVIPITPKPGMELFGYPPNLFPQKRALGLSRQHVYYRSGRSNPFELGPGRILWYMSKDRDRAIHEYFGISRLSGSEVLDAQVAHERYSQLGVYRRAAVSAAADKNGRVNVVHLEDTELLASPLPLGTFRQIAERHNVRGEMQSPRRIPPDLFREIVVARHRPYGPSSA